MSSWYFDETKDSGIKSLTKEKSYLIKFTLFDYEGGGGEDQEEKLDHFRRLFLSTFKFYQ